MKGQGDRHEIKGLIRDGGLGRDKGSRWVSHD